ncbi:ABC transporter substrate-binding protein [Nocardia miyunensis]|uniref:ABC transporter substrate-binding protein n=1 Tax=Nocardia miyunensis TaxID=282684 RepID=UPI0014717D87|nr:ABC transporter substrate-binding protein [Nocardia miyunensis]
MLTLAVAGCGSSTGTDETGAATSADSAAVFGAPNAASGDPVTIGFISDGKGDKLDNTDEIKGARAAAAYANDYLGGLAGRRIEVKVCEVRQNPAAATDCANQMVTAGVSAVMEGALAEVDQTISVLAPAGIPLLVHSSATEAVQKTPGVFSLYNGLAYYGVPASDARDQGVHKAALIGIAVPGVEGPARTTGTLLYKNAGIVLDITAIAPGTADMTPQITAAGSDKPQLYHIFGNDSFCTSAMKAIKTVDPTAAVTMIDTCISPTSGKSIPGGYEGAHVVTTADLDTSTHDAKLFRAVLGKYGDHAAVRANSAFGYSPMLATVTALNAGKITDFSPAGVLSAIKAAPATEYPMAMGAKFQCDGKQMGLSPNMCGSSGLIATANKDGVLSDYKLIPSDPKLYSNSG